jgi:hypothetical protein
MDYYRKPEALDFRVDPVKIKMDELPQILPKFFIPPLADKPQNPIMDTLKLASQTSDHHLSALLPPELAVISTVSSFEQQFPNPPTVNNLWAEAITRKFGVRVCPLSLQAR